MTLPICILIVDAKVDPDAESEWNRWYDNVHLPEIIQCPGFCRAARYVNETDGSRSYLTVYELESPEAIESVEFSQRRGWGKFRRKIQASVRIFRQITHMEPG